jgi:hypothetical protein
MLFVLVALFSVVTAQTAADCAAFCSDYNTTCMGLSTMNDIYTDMQACQDECMRFPVDSNCQTGDITDAANCGSGNSWGCRRYHLNVAMSNTSDTNNVTHCPHTTPLSSPSSSITASDALTGTVCKTTINGTTPATGQNGLVADFCNQVVSACPAWLNTLDMPKCVSYFSHVTGATDVANYPDGTNRKFPVAPITGAGLPCRRYHAQVARQSDANAKEHCKHALFGADACGSPCEQLCSMGPAICPASFDTATCMSDCASKVPVAVDPDYKVVTNHDIVCRLYHLAVASESADLNMGHCSHATIVSTPETCGAATLSVSALFLAALALITKFAS